MFCSIIRSDKHFLEKYIARLSATGRITFSAQDASQALGHPVRLTVRTARRLKQNGLLSSPRQGFYVIVPPQFRDWGAPPPSWFIDDLMRHEGHRYYVALLKAAELHDAAHQAVQEFQVVTDLRLPKLTAGRSLIVFHHVRDLSVFAAGIESRKTESGTMSISSAELTAFDLVRFAHSTGGLGNVLTVLGELGAKLDRGRLAILCPLFEAAVRQRLGYLLEKAAHPPAADILFASLVRDRSFRWTELEPSRARIDPALVADSVQRDRRWRLVVRREPKSDES